MQVLVLSFVFDLPNIFVRSYLDTEEGMAQEIHITNTGSPDVLPLREVYAAAEAGILTADIWKTYLLTQAPDAHQSLESRTAMGPTVLRPE